MLTKCTYLLIVVCFALAMASVLPGGGSMPGGVGPCEEYDQLHTVLANFALGEIGNGYTLQRIACARIQVVAGIRYIIELYATKTTNGTESCHRCNVTVLHVPWGAGPKFTLENNFCAEETTLNVCFS
ncbi:uncharacterized protein LOC123528585 [Mercenaria mercenaria]|uniref:uncharacterized protein LOC123528585 n=1 Tax=Mercenaria mercenaria TaxID=6596 RepID=UPI00234EB23C|nr:uncharacterized protein LOC123528585 [Mercenaria mercenaria]